MNSLKGVSLQTETSFTRSDLGYTSVSVLSSHTPANSVVFHVDTIVEGHSSFGMHGVVGIQSYIKHADYKIFQTKMAADSLRWHRLKVLLVYFVKQIAEARTKT